MSDHHFWDLPEMLEPGDLVVVNRTRVRAARLLGHKVGSGGNVEALLLGPVTANRWRAAVKPARKVRAGTELEFGPIKATVLEEPVAGIALLELETTEELEAAISRTGHLPLPPYIKKELADSERYQTIFARPIGSAAAPTAGLHFTDELVRRLSARSIELAEVELRIGLDTFRPISSETVEDHQIHSEEFSIGAKAAEKIAVCRGRVVAVGTTVVRALESSGVEGTTSLFITPGFRFRTVNLLVTNFHLPRTTLLVLLAAFMGSRWRVAYETAIARQYRFASFGDAMLAERAS
jgi:S-adenosylmethionine:tRNA ribosyltransferase-isomerase